MNDGERLGGDPIIYTGNQTLGFAEFLQALPVKHAQIANQTEHCCSPIRVLFVHAVERTRLREREVVVLLLRCLGMTQQEIADNLGLSRAEICKTEQRARAKVSN
jgi:DNA-binding CsgD family transcriptional regulator